MTEDPQDYIEPTIVQAFDEAIRAVNNTPRHGQAHGTLHYPQLCAAGALVDMMDRIFDVQGVKSRPTEPVRALKYSLKRRKK